MVKTRKTTQACTTGICRSYKLDTPRSSMDEWYLHGKEQFKITQKRGISAENVVRQTDKAKDDAEEVIMQNKKQTEMRLEERISDLSQARMELENVSGIIQNELESMHLLKERIRDGIRMIKDKALTITQKCMILREGRLGIDLSQDRVEKELEVEKKKIMGAERILIKSLDEAEEHMRLLRASLYTISKDIEDKGRVLSIECDCLNTKETSLNLSQEGDANFSSSNITVEEWASYTADMMKSSWEKIQSVRIFRVNVKALLKDIVSDLKNQCERVNAAFQERITEMKDAKAKLQIQHFEITRQINDMNQNIAELKTFIKDKEAFLALARTRLEKRSNRQGIELVKDSVEATLIREVVDMKQLIQRLEKMLAEADLSLKDLLKTQLQLEDNINVKNNSLKIDEVDCMSMRQRIEYHDV